MVNFQHQDFQTVKFERNENEPKWQFKQSGIVTISHDRIRRESGELSWNEGWTERLPHTGKKLNKNFMLNIFNISPNKEKWLKDTGLNFTQEYHETERYDFEGSTTVVRGASYLDVKDAYLYDESFLNALHTRINEIGELKKITTNKDKSKEFDILTEELKRKSSVGDFVETYEARLPEPKYSTFNHESIEKMDIQEFVHHLTT